MKSALITITRQGIDLGRKILESDGAADLYLSTKYGAPAGEREFGFDGNVKNLLAEIYPKYDGFIFIMAAGIVVRMIADYVKDKKYDPAVVVMDIRGKFSIALLSGHLGGANELAVRIAGIVGAIPVITTGTDVNETIAPDMIAKEIGAEIEDFEKMKLVSAAIVDGQRVGVLDRAGSAPKSLKGELKKNIVLCQSVEELNSSGCKAAIVISEEILTGIAIPETLFLRPKILVLGLGCNRGTPAAEFEESVGAILAEQGLAFKSIRSIASIDLKKDEEGLLHFAEGRRLRVDFFSREEIDALGPLPNPSEKVEEHIGVKGVAEPAALLAAGPGGRLVIQKVKRRNLTVAVARCETK